MSGVRHVTENAKVCQLIQAYLFLKYAVYQLCNSQWKHKCNYPSSHIIKSKMGKLYHHCCYFSSKYGCNINTLWIFSCDVSDKKTSLAKYVLFKTTNKAQINNGPTPVIFDGCSQWMEESNVMDVLVNCQLILLSGSSSAGCYSFGSMQLASLALS